MLSRREFDRSLVVGQIGRPMTYRYDYVMDRFYACYLLQSKATPGSKRTYVCITYVPALSRHRSQLTIAPAFTFQGRFHSRPTSSSPSTQWRAYCWSFQNKTSSSLGNANDRLRFPFQTHRLAIRMGLAETGTQQTPSTTSSLTCSFR